MLLFADILSWSATVVGLLAGSVAVGGFLAHIGPALSEASEVRLRTATVIGGTAGLGLGAGIVVLSAFVR